MFQLSERLSGGSTRSQNARRYLKRAGLFAGGLILLWVALQLVPSSASTAESEVYSDDAGTVATAARPESTMPSLFSTGNLVALLLLGGGAGFAVYLRRKTKNGGNVGPIVTLGEVSIGQNQSLRLVECGDEVLLLGVTSGQINLLRSYPAEHYEELSAPSVDGGSSQSHQGSHFSDVLRHYAGGQVSVGQNGTTC